MPRDPGPGPGIRNEKFERSSSSVQTFKLSASNRINRIEFGMLLAVTTLIAGSWQTVQ